MYCVLFKDDLLTAPVHLQPV